MSQKPMFKIRHRAVRQLVVLFVGVLITAIGVSAAASVASTSQQASSGLTEAGYAYDAGPSVLTPVAERLPRGESLRGVHRRTGSYQTSSARPYGNDSASAPTTSTSLRFVATKTGDKAGDKRNTPDQGALIDIADEADKRRGGVTPGEAEILKDWGKELGVPVRGPEAHPGRGHGAKEHIHVGPKNHIPVKR